MRAFQNGLKERHFNESFTPKPATSMVEIMAQAECYIKWEESNAEKKVKDVKKRVTSGSDHSQ